MPRSNANLLQAGAVYLQSNLPLTIAQKYPLMDRLRRAGAIRRMERSGTNYKYRVGRSGTTNPWAFKGAGFAAQSTPAASYYNNTPDYINYIVAKIEAPWAIDTDQRERFDKANNDQKGAIIEALGKEMTQFYATFIATKFGGSAGATDQGAGSMMSLNFMGDNANSIGGLAAATGHAAKVEANFVISIPNMRRVKRYMNEQRNANPSVWVVSTNSAGNDLEGKLSQYATQATVVQSTDKKPNVSQDEYTILNLPVTTLSTLPANDIYLLDESELAIEYPEAPDKTQQYVIPGTAVVAETLYAYIGFFPLAVKNQWHGSSAQ